MTQMTQSHLDATGYGHVIQESRKAAGTLIELKYASFVMMTCLGALYRNDQLPNHITSMIDDPELIESAKKIAVNVMSNPDTLDFTFHPTPDRVWPAFLAEAAVMKYARGQDGDLVDADFALSSNQKINLTDTDNQHFSKKDMDLQIQAADICHCIVSPFIDKCMKKIRHALGLGDEVTIDTMITVFDHNMKTANYSMTTPLNEWFLPIYTHLQEEDMLDGQTTCLTRPVYYH